MTIRWWGMLTLAAFLGLTTSLGACGKKGPLEPPPGGAEETSGEAEKAPTSDQPARPDNYSKPQGSLF